MKKISNAIPLFREVINLAKDVNDFAKSIMELVRSRPELQYDPNNRDVVSTTLHRMQEVQAPRLALLGITSAGKSTLVNALFGNNLAETRRTRDTTKSVLQVDFPSGLRIYDTPGVISDEHLENVTRAFLGLRQISSRKDHARVTNIPIEIAGSKNNISVPIEEIREKAPLDLVLLAVNIFEPPDRLRSSALAELFSSLESRYPGSIVVVGTHLDEVRKLSDKDEQNQIIADWAEVFYGNMVAVSSKTGEGLDELVVQLFRALPGSASLAKLQEALNVQRKLSRLAFVVAETSSLLASLSLLRGDQPDEIRVATVMIFALICNHYSVDEDTWGKFNGNALKIADYVESQGIQYSSKMREPHGFWETLKGWFGATFFETIASYKQLGIDGISTLIPRVYKLIHEFEGYTTPALPDSYIRERMNTLTKQIDAGIKKGDVAMIAPIIDKQITAFLALEDS